jgi:hypothetical protein
MAHEVDPQIVAAIEAEARAEQVTLQRVDEATAMPRPTSIGDTYAETENEALEVEQPELFSAAGLDASRNAAIEAAGLELAGTAGGRLLEGHATVLEASEQRLLATLAALASFRRRPPKAERWHYIAKGAFLFGDIAGIASAAIMLGEIPGVAVVMAISAAAATVVAGLSGGEVRDVRARDRRARPLDQLSEVQAPFAHLFEANDEGWRFVKALCWVSVSVAAIIACGIFALRASVDDPLVGAVFGGIAAAIAAASWIESYMYADDIADLITHATADYQHALELHQHLAESPVWKQWQEALTEADSITGEHQHRGAAARHHLRSLRYGILRRNPHIVGHGPAAESPASHQTARRGVAK